MQNINTILREARESRGLSIKDAAKALNLKERYIEMLEDGQIAQLSREIYLKGLLKAYSNWLNIDGGDTLARINQEKNNIAIKRSNVPVIPIDLSYLAALARRPGLNIFVVSVILAVVIYIFWYSIHKTVGGADIVTSIAHVNDQQVNVKYSNVQDPYLDRDIVFFPHANVELKIIDTGTGEEKINKLSEGDLFFLKIDDAMVLSSDSPESIEVFVDNNGQQDLIGTLDKMLITF
jgi:transcriptional regulator with XRE-family HTH domain